jgi:VWFA-related protein
LLLDTSESMRARFDNLRAAASAFVDALRPEDAVMVASFSGRTYVHSEMTRDRSAARDAILQTRLGGSGSRLYDAIDVVLTERLAAVQGRKVMVVLSDGLDVDSGWATSWSVLERVQAANVAIYALQYDTAADPAFGRMRMLPKGVRVDAMPAGLWDQAAADRAGRFLDDIARTSGGRVVRAAMPEDIARAFDEIAAEVRQQYVLYYYPPPTARDGALHTIRVEALRPGVSVRTRTAYRAR